MTAALDLRTIDDASCDPAAAPEFVPARRPLATVTVLRPPAQSPGAAPVRLTRRGLAVLAAAVATLGVALVWLAAASAPRSAVAPTSASGAGHAVVVRAGDTLWSIALRVAPDRDPRAEVAALQRVNSIHDSDVAPGQVLRLP